MVRFYIVKCCKSKTCPSFSTPKPNGLLLLVTLVVAPIEKLIKSEPNFAKNLGRKFWKVIFHLTTLKERWLK